MSAAAKLPSYADQLDAFHMAFEAELRALVQSIPLSPAMQVLDVGCGDGFYMRLLAERLMKPGAVTGLDLSSAFLDLARRRLDEAAPKCDVDFWEAPLTAIYDRREQFDLVWCAQSLYSLPDPLDSVRRMAEAVRPGGFVVILENDTLHQLLLPWPTPVELALRNAEYRALAAETRKAEKYYVGRRLPLLLAEAGLEPLGVRTQASDRMAPLDPALEEFVRGYLADLHERTTPIVDDVVASQLAEYVLPDGPHYLLNQPHFALCWMNVLAWGRKPVEG
jgi:ubiquinone/menaquinone biosynthesis C-methylase UbiE